MSCAPTASGTALYRAGVADAVGAVPASENRLGATKMPTPTPTANAATIATVVLLISVLPIAQPKFVFGPRFECNAGPEGVQALAPLSQLQHCHSRGS